MENILAQLNDRNSWRESYERVRPLIEAFPDEKFAFMNVDVVAAATTVLGALPRIAELRAEIAKCFRGFDFENFDRLADYARAAAYVHTRANTTVVAPDQLRAIGDRLALYRETFLSDAKALVKRDFLDEGVLRKVRGSIGYANLVWDVAHLVTALEDNWTKIEGKCGVSRDELANAADLVAYMQEVLGARKLAPHVSPEIARIRAQAFSLFALTYDEARSAVLFVRRHSDDGEKIAPSLYAGRGGRKRVEVDEDAEKETNGAHDAASPAEKTPVVSTPAISETGGTKSPAR